MLGRDFRGEKYRFGFNGKEKNTELNSDNYDFGARIYDGRIGRWYSVDPLFSKRNWLTPYNFVQNKPITKIDPNGALDAPIFDSHGDLLGTDNEGLKGDPIIMEKENFKQGMLHADAKKRDIGTKGLKDDVAKFIFQNNYKGLKSRPDYDGFLTQGEANKWYREGNGKPLFVDASKIDLKPLDIESLKLGKMDDYNFYGSSNYATAGVYGNILLTLLDNSGTVQIGNDFGEIDDYNFDIDWSDGQHLRNIGTWVGKKRAGNGTGYTIMGYGHGKVEHRPDPNNSPQFPNGL